MKSPLTNRINRDSRRMRIVLSVDTDLERRGSEIELTKSKYGYWHSDKYVFMLALLHNPHFCVIVEQSPC